MDHMKIVVLDGYTENPGDLALCLSIKIAQFYNPPLLLAKHVQKLAYDHLV